MGSSTYDTINLGWLIKCTEGSQQSSGFTTLHKKHLCSLSNLYLYIDLSSDTGMITTITTGILYCIPCADPGIFVRGGPGQSDPKKL